MFDRTTWHREWRAKNRKTVRTSENKWRSKTPSYRKKMKAYAKSYRPIKNEKRQLPESRYQYSLQLSARRKKSWAISFENYLQLIKKPCHYCFGPLSQFGVGLDRKDSSLGYELDNVVPCCGDCNMIKGRALSYDEMVIAMKAINFYRKNKNKEEEGPLAVLEGA